MTTPTDAERAPDVWTPPKPVIFAFDLKKPKPDQYAAYTVMQLHDAYRAGQAARSLPVDGLDAERLTKAQIKKLAVANGAFNAGDSRGLILWEDMGALGGGIEGLVRAAIALKQQEQS